MTMKIIFPLISRELKKKVFRRIIFHPLQFYCLPNKYKKLSCSTAPLCKERKSMGKLLLPQRINFFMAVYSQTPQKLEEATRDALGHKNHDLNADVKN